MSNSRGNTTIPEYRLARIRGLFSAITGRDKSPFVSGEEALNEFQSTLERMLNEHFRHFPRVFIAGATPYAKIITAGFSGLSYERNLEVLSPMGVLCNLVDPFGWNYHVHTRTVEPFYPITPFVSGMHRLNDVLYASELLTFCGVPPHLADRVGERMGSRIDERSIIFDTVQGSTVNPNWVSLVRALQEVRAIVMSTNQQWPFNGTLA